MKIFTKIVLVSLLIANLFCCSDKRKLQNVICDGYVYDSIGGKPSEGVVIYLDACASHDGRNYCATYSVGKATTNAAGYYKIKEKAARSGRYYLYGAHLEQKGELHSGDLRDSKITTGYLKYYP